MNSNTAFKYAAEVHKLLRLYSTQYRLHLQQVKEPFHLFCTQTSSYLSTSTMTEKRLNNCNCLHVRKDNTNQINNAMVAE